MYIFRWLMKHPLIILALYFLSIAAILYSMTGGGSSENKADTTKIVEEQKTSSADVDLAEAPAIEPSNLTSALVTGEPSTGAESSEIVASKVETENINPEERELLFKLLFEEKVSRNQQFDRFEEPEFKRLHRMSKHLKSIHQELLRPDGEYWVEELEN